jgi:hypothetical protein
MTTQPIDPARRDRAGGFAALYVALAYLAAMPFFLLVVDYQEARTAAEKVASIVRNHQSMNAMYLLSYVLFGVVLAVLALSLFDRLLPGGELMARVATAVGLTWSVALVLSGLVFTAGMDTVVSLAGTSPEQAAAVWPPIESVADGLGGAGGETLGGLWLLLVSWTALRAGALSKPLNWLGLAVGCVGMASTVPALRDAVVVSGLVQIVWFGWLAVVLFARRADASPAQHRQSALAA